MTMAMISIVGCYTQNKALKAVKKANYKHPEVVADFTRSAYPCIDIKLDTIVKYDTSYEFVEIACPDVQNGVDTSNKTVVKYVTKIVKIPSKTIYITKKVEDSAKISILMAQISQMRADNEKLMDKYTKRKTWLYSFLKALIVSILLNLFFIYRKYGAITKVR